MADDPRTHFLPWTEPALPQAARFLMERYERDGVARMDDVSVVLPGGRAGRRLKELLTEVADRSGARLVPPRVVTLGRVPELLYAESRPVASEALSHLAWVQTLRRAPAHRLERVFPRRPDADAVHEWGLLARELQRVHRDVGRGGHRFDDVAKSCRASARAGRLSWNDADRWAVLAEVQHEYAVQLERVGVVDRDLARMEAIGAGRLEAPGDVWLIGVSEVSSVVRDSLRAVGERVRALVHAPEDRRDAFDALGCVIPEAWLGAELPLDDDRLAVVEEPADQADEVVRVLAGLEGRRAAEEIVVGVPDPTVVPWVIERLDGAGVEVRDAAGTPVRATPPFRLLSAAADFLETRRFDAFAALVRHPDVADWVARRSAGEGPLSRPGGWLTELDEWYDEHLPARLPRRGVALTGGRGGRGEVVAELRRRVEEELLGSLDDDPAERPLGAWIAPLLGVLERVYGVRDLRPDRLPDRRLLRALELLGEAAGAFADLPAGLDLRCTATRAVRIVLDEAGGRALPPDPSRAAVELLGWLELHLDDAPVTVLTGVNEPRLPESVTADPFLPDALRRELGLVDNRVRYARDAYRLTAMVHSTERLHLIAGRRSASGDPLRPSRLLFAADARTAARRVRRFYDDVGRGDRGAAHPDPAPRADGSGSGFRLPPEPELRLEEPVRSLRVTEFRALLTDPYGWALARLRGCEPLRDDAREMDGLLFGGLAHRVLQDFGEDQEVVHSTDAGAIRDGLDRLLDRQVARRFGPDLRHTQVAVRLQVEQLRARLHRFADWHAAWIARGWRVVGVELGTPEGGIPFEVDGTPLGIRARIDRVDRHEGDDRWAVFDYKTSDAGPSPEGTHRSGRGDDKTWVDLQLPLYRWLLPRLTTESGERRFPELATDAAGVDVGYIRLPRELDEVGDAMAEWSATELEEALQAARDVVRRVREGVFTFDPAVGSVWADPELEALLGRGQLAGVDEGEDG